MKYVLLTLIRWQNAPSNESFSSFSGPGSTASLGVPMWLKDWICSYLCSQNQPLDRGNTRGFNPVMEPTLVSPRMPHAHHQWPTVFIDPVCSTIGPPPGPPSNAMTLEPARTPGPPLGVRPSHIGCLMHVCRYGFLYLPVTLSDKNLYPTWSQMGKCCIWPL